MERRGVDAVQITSDLNPASLGRADVVNSGGTPVVHGKHAPSQVC